MMEFEIRPRDLIDSKKPSTSNNPLPAVIPASGARRIPLADGSLPTHPTNIPGETQLPFSDMYEDFFKTGKEVPDLD